MRTTIFLSVLEQEKFEFARVSHVSHFKMESQIGGDAGMGDNIVSKASSKNDEFSAKSVADYLDFGAAKEFPNDPESQRQGASMRLFMAVEDNLSKNAPSADKACAPYGALQGFSQENPYGYCANDNIKTTDRFLEEVRKLEKADKGLNLVLKKDNPDASYNYDVVPKKAN